MKKIFLVFFTIIIIFIVGCTKTETKEKTENVGGTTEVI